LAGLLLAMLLSHVLLSACRESTHPQLNLLNYIVKSSDAAILLQSILPLLPSVHRPATTGTTPEGAAAVMHSELAAQQTHHPAPDAQVTFDAFEPAPL
jgi:hypothetical protein